MLRVDLESQDNRTIEQGTINWWATQGAAQDEAFAEDGRIPLDQALDELHKTVLEVQSHLDEWSHIRCQHPGACLQELSQTLALAIL
jgi:hypothetical protein